jgi:hypothetical protein
MAVNWPKLHRFPLNDAICQERTLSSNAQSSKSLTVMVGAAIAVWAGTFAFVYGPFVFGYLAMHAVTTGIFILAIRRSDRINARQPLAQPALATASHAVRPKADRVARPQPVA